MGFNDGLYKYPPELEELAFTLYIECDRNISRTHRMLVQHCTPEDGLLDDNVSIPDRSTISRWAKHKEWDAKIDEQVAEQFPNLRRRQLARLALITDRAIENHAAILNGELDNLPGAALVARSAMVKEAYLVTGMGPNMAGKDVPQPTPSVPLEEKTLTVQERMRRQRERLEAERG